MQTIVSHHEPRLMLNTASGLYFFSPEEIIRLEASSNYTYIYFSNQKKMLTSRGLKEFEQLLRPFGFVRTHRTHLVNRQHILYVTKDSNIVMKDTSIAGISRRMKTVVMQELKLNR